MVASFLALNRYLSSLQKLHSTHPAEVAPFSHPTASSQCNRTIVACS